MSNDLQRSGGGVSGFFRALTMSGADRANEINRGITEYAPGPVDAFFDPSRGVFNAVISGGSRAIRTSAMVAQAVCANQCGFPVIVLHEGDRMLEQQLRANFEPVGMYAEISPARPCFEPFFGMDDMAVSNLIMECAPKNYDIKINVAQYVAGLGQFLRKRGAQLTFRKLRTCPHGQIFDIVSDLHAKGGLTDSELNAINAMLMAGQSECYKLQMFLDMLKNEIGPMCYEPKTGQKRTNVLTAVNDRKVLSFDLGSVANGLLLSTAVYQLKLAMTKGQQYVVIFDSIPVNTNEAYANYLKTPSHQISKTVASDDFYAMVGGKEETFMGLVGDCGTLMVMAHTSAGSAAKWSGVFGEYDKYEQSYTTSHGSSRRTPFSLFSSPNQQRSVNTTKSRSFIIRPEQITHMAEGEAYVLCAGRGELAHLILTG